MLSCESIAEGSLSTTIYTKNIGTAAVVLDKPVEHVTYLKYIHVLRGIAIISVLAGHCIDAFDWTNDNILFRSLCLLFKNGTYLFVFLSGFLFQHLQYKYSTKKYFKSKINNVLLPYTIMSIPAILFFVFFTHRPNIDSRLYDMSMPYQILTFYLTGSHLTSYWYIPVILIFFAVSPLLLFLEKKKILYFLIPVLIGVSIIIPRGGSLFYNCFHFFSVYIIGMLASKYKSTFTGGARQYLIYILFLCVLFAVSGFLANGRLAAFSIYLLKISSCFLFIAIYLKLERKEMPERKLLEYLASISFGLYFVHPYVISGLRYLHSGIVGATLSMDGTLARFTAFLIVIIFVSVIIVEMCKLVFGRYSKYLIGS